MFVDFGKTMINTNFPHSTKICTGNHSIIVNVRICTGNHSIRVNVRICVFDKEYYF